MDWEKSRSQSGEARVRVMVVDDEPLIRWSVASTLGDAGYEVEIRKMDGSETEVELDKSLNVVQRADD